MNSETGLRVDWPKFSELKSWHVLFNDMDEVLVARHLKGFDIRVA